MPSSPSSPRLNDLQLVLLAGAAGRENHSLIPLPDSCTQDTTRIGKAVSALLRRALVEERPVTDPRLAWREEDQERIGLFITEAGLAAIGAQQADTDTGPDADAASPVDQTPAASAPAPTPRQGSKIAAVITLLEREQGATLEEMTAATGWLTHTTRAALTGLRKKGRTIERTRREDTTCYRITESEGA